MKFHLFASFTALLPMLVTGQTTEFGNIDVIQNDAGNSASSVTLSVAAGSSPALRIGTGSSRADYYVDFGYANDFNTGVLISSVSQNGRDNTASGDTIGRFDATSSVELNSTVSPTGWYIPTFRSPNGDEANINVSCAHFPYSTWLGGVARNASNTNGGTIDTLTASSGISLGNQFASSGGGVYALDLTGLGAGSQSGVLLVSHAKNEDNFALSRANPDGTFGLYVKDNGTNGAGTEQDPVAFVYLPVSAVGTNRLHALGRINNDATADVSGGSFSVSKGAVGQWYLTITGESPATGTLLVSPEGNDTNNSDNIVSYEWDGVNSRYVIESRDIVSTTAALVPQDGGTATEDMFSFAFFKAPVVPVVAINSPADGAGFFSPATFTVDVSANDANGSVTMVELIRDGELVGADTDAPYGFEVTGLGTGTYHFVARATDNDGYPGLSAPLRVSVTLDPANLPSNTALQFDGVNDYVTMGAAPELNVGGPPGNGMTLECWFRKEGDGLTASSGTGGVVVVPLFAKGRGEADGDNRDCDFIFGITADGRLAADFETYPASGLTSGQNYPVTASNTPIENGQWHHAAVTYDGATAIWKVYLDGVEVGTATAAAGALPRYDSIQHFAIGSALTSTGASQGAFAGSIDEVRIWDHARTAAEIADHLAEELGTEPGLLGRFGLNEGGGTFTTSSTAGASVGTFSSSPAWTNGAPLALSEPPAVTLTSPVDGFVAYDPADISLAADASDGNGTVVQVDFLRDGQVIATDTHAPYMHTDSNPGIGSHSYTARAIDNEGFTSTSAPAQVSITLDPGNLPDNTALIFDGVDDYVTMGVAPELGAGGPPSNGMTLECWFMKESGGTTASSGAGGVSAFPLFAKGRGETDGNNTDCNYLFGINGSGLLVADYESFDSGQNYPIIASHTPVTNGVWHHAAVTYDGNTGTWTMYLDGSPAGTSSAPVGTLPRYDSIQHFAIGAALNSNGAREGAFAGIIDEIRIWDHARSASEIALSKDLALSTATGLIGRFGLDEGVGLSTASSVGTMVGMLVNGPLWTNGVSLSVNEGPQVTLTAPADSSQFTAPAAFTMTADASDADGTIAGVSFRINGAEVGYDNSEPYQFDVTGLAMGNYTLTAVAADDFGFTATSATAVITVDPPVTNAPQVSIVSPVDGASFLNPADILIEVSASDSDGTIAKVEFFEGANKIGEDVLPPYSITWSGAGVGTYDLTAVATDDQTATSASTTVQVVVVANQPPVIVLASPGDHATNVGTAGSVTLEATVTDPENQAMTVTFYGRESAPEPGPDFTLVTIPDTQYYSQNNNNRFPQFLSQTNWIVSSKDTLNTAFVAHMGDMVQNGDSVAAEWVRADQAMDIIEDPATTLLTHGIPWGGAPGNHDQQPIGSADGATLYWNHYFGTSRWAGRPYYGGNYGSNNDNNYQLFSASGLDFVIVNLEYRTSANQAVLDWADSVLKAYPNRRAIVTSHWLIGTGNPASWGGHGKAVYDNLKDNPNLFLMLCGHIHGEGQRTDVFEGRTVKTVLQDFQSLNDGEGGGGSWLRYFVFSPANNTIHAKTYRTTTGDFNTNAASDFTFPYEMGGPSPWVELGTVSVPAGDSEASIEWTGLAAESGYEWYAAVSDGPNAVGSASRSFNTTTNVAPLVSLDAPLDSAVIARPASVEFSVTASDADGSVALVEFYQNAEKIGEDATAPYGFTWSPPSGSYGVSARAIDNQGAVSDSVTATVTVTNPNNSSPLVALTRPGDGSAVPGGTLRLEADASDSDGVVTKVEFFNGVSKIGEDESAPYELDWLAVSPGNYTLSAVATDNDGGTSSSTAVAVTVLPVTDLTFQDGLGGYAGTVDTDIHSDTSSQNIAYGTNPDMSIDADDGDPGNAPNHGLIRFENIIGSALSQIPAGSVINSAVLRFTVFNPGSGLTVHRMLTTWNESSTWGSLTGGIQTDGVEAAAAAVAYAGADNESANIASGLLDLSVTAAVQAWADGADNHGLALLPFPSGTDGIDVRTREYAVVAERPALIVNFTAPPANEVTITASDASGGEFGADQALEFTISRSGPTNEALLVPLVASGTATPGDDFTGLAGSVEIPASATSATLPLTVLADGLAEGTETITLTIDASQAYRTGSPASAEVSIFDAPAQNYYFANISDPAKRGPTDDADGDHSANIVEYFMGTVPDDASSRAVLEIPLAGPGSFKVRFPRAKNRLDVSGSLHWSSDLVNWHSSGDGDGALTVTFVETVVSETGADPEIVEATGTLEGDTGRRKVFVRLAVE